MSRCKLISLAVVFLLLTLVQAREAAETDERLLQSIGLTTDTRALLEFLRLRTLRDGDATRLEALAKQLGNASYALREQATRELVMRGPLALPYLKSSLKSAPLEVIRRAEQCISKIESIGPEHPAAAARLLARRRTPEAVPVLFAYLPHAGDDWLREEVLASLGELLLRSGKVDPLLTAALKDPVPANRAAAVYILARRGGGAQRQLVRGFLTDPSPEVRESAAAGLVGKHLLRNLRDTAGADEALVKANRVAVDEAGIIEFLRRRTLSAEDQKKLAGHIRQLGASAFYARAEASRKLVEVGAPALPFLTEAARDPDLEISRRAGKCIEEIKRGPGPALPAAAIRLLARPRSAGQPPALAVQTLLAYVPFADDNSVQEELINCLSILSVFEPKIESSLPAALDDPVPARRAAAAEVLGRIGTADQCRAVRKLFADPVPLVRFRAARGLVAAQDKGAVPVLIALLTEPGPYSWQVEDLLHVLADDTGPVAVADGTEEGKKKFVQAWERWWQANVATIELAGRDGPVHRGLITVCEYDTMQGQPVGQVYELTRDGQQRWKIGGLSGPMDAEVLPSGRVLIAENAARRVTERDLAGKIHWQFDLAANPISCQRLPNGNTFIATYNQVMEVTPARRTVFVHGQGPGFFVFSARKLPNGRIVCINAQGKVLEIDATTGKEVRTVNAGPAGGWASAEPLANGRYLVASMSSSRVRELDATGKVYWEAAMPGVFRAIRLPSGNTLACSMTTRKIAEYDRNGQLRWEKTCSGRPWGVRSR